MTTKTRRRAPLTDEQRAERRAADRQFAAQAVAALHESDGWQSWLRVRCTFRTYSLHNQLLIALQCPTATRVAGFRAWIGLGYHVRKGERALRIWVPMTPTRKQLAAWKADGGDPDKQPRTYFKLGPVFDRSQVDPLPDTDPTPLEPPIRELTGDDLAWALPALEQLAQDLGCTVATQELPAGTGGFYRPGTKEIVIAAASSVNHRVHTMIHELGHALIHADADASYTYAQEELVVESVTYTVAAGLDFDTSQFAIPYLASWSNGDMRFVEQTATVVDQLARRIEKALDGYDPAA